ncbi:hypothetical protein KR018_002119, partial [Drosophila ironensis]
MLLPLIIVLLLAANLPKPAESRTTASGGLTVIDAARTTSSTSTTSTTSTSTSTSTGTTTTTSNSTSNDNALGTTATSSSPRKRHRKRNSNWIDYRNFNESTTALEWVNPCAGNYHPPVGNRNRRNRQRPRQSFNQLKHHAFREYRSLNSTQDSPIDIHNMNMWSLHTHNYKFLPKLKPNSTIALKRWYRNMQTYVASFAFLRRMQIKWDQRSITRESRTARELRELLLSSRRILCELETAVNQTQSPRQKQRRSGDAAVLPPHLPHSPPPVAAVVSLPQISRLEMNKRLKLRSKAARPESGTGSGSGLSPVGEADAIDMRFVKHHYYDFLRTMWQLLRRDGRMERHRPRHQRHHHNSNNNDNNSKNKNKNNSRSNSKSRSKTKTKTRSKKKQQQLKEHLWRSSSGSTTTNRKEFNEVSKP